MVGAEGVYFWDAEGKRYLDWSSQAFNVNVGHAHPHVVKAMQEQVARLSYAGPGMATEVRGRLGQMLAEITPPGLNKSFFTLGGADAVENAIKMARMVTGRQKVLARYRAYHEQYGYCSCRRADYVLLLGMGVEGRLIAKENYLFFFTFSIETISY